MINEKTKEIYKYIIVISKMIDELHNKKNRFIKNHFNFENYTDIDIYDIEDIKDSDKIDINSLDEDDFDNKKNYEKYKDIMKEIESLEKVITILCKDNSIFAMDNRYDANKLRFIIGKYERDLIIHGEALCDRYNNSYIFSSGYLNDIYLKRIKGTNFGIGYSLEDNSEYLFYIRRKNFEMQDDLRRELQDKYLLLCKLNTTAGYTTFKYDEYTEENAIIYEDFRIIDENKIIIKQKWGKEYRYFVFERTIKQYYYQEPYTTEGKWGTFFHDGGWIDASLYHITDDVINCPATKFDKLTEEEGLEIWSQYEKVNNSKKLTLHKNSRNQKNK